MKSSIFKQVTEECFASQFKFKGQDRVRELGDEYARIVNENKDALIQAWVAETGVRPSKATLCEKWDGPVLKMRNYALHKSNRVK